MDKKNGNFGYQPARGDSQRGHQPTKPNSGHQPATSKPTQPPNTGSSVQKPNKK